MSGYEMIGIGLFLTAALAATVWLVRRRGERLTAAVIALGAVMGLLLIVEPRIGRRVQAVIVLDQPAPAGAAPDLERLVGQLARTGATRVALVVVDPTAKPKSDLVWTDAGRADILDRLRGEAATAPTPSDALSMALDGLESHDWLSNCWDCVEGTAGRAVVGVTDPALWRDWQSVDVDRLLEVARRQGTSIDRIELDPRLAATAVDIQAPLSLLADRELRRHPVGLVVSVRSPQLAEARGQKVSITVRGRLDGDAAVLDDFKTDGCVSSTGDLDFNLPMDAFQTPAGISPVFPEGFVRCDLEVRVEVDGKEATGAGAAYLPVRKGEALIVCGKGSGATRLLVPGLLSKETPVADDVQRLQAQAKALESPRARAAAEFHFVAPDEFRRRLTRQESLPFLAVLHECPPDFWDAVTVEQLERAVRQGMHLLVVDPPARPADPDLAERLGQLLPALARPDERWSDPRPRVADRTPILNIVFDAGRWGALQETPGPEASRKALRDAFDVQRAAVAALVARYRGEQGPLYGSLDNDQGARRIAYHSDPRDRLLVRVAPVLRAADPLVDTAFGSAMELRTAALFAGDLKGLVGTEPGGVDPTGLNPALVAGNYPSGDPAFTPNQALVVFTGNVPQPLPGPFGAPISYTLDGGAARTAVAPPSDVLGRMLLRGVTTAVVRLEVPPYEDGFRDMTRYWPGPGVNPLTSFRADPEQVLTAALGRLDQLAVGSASWLTPAQAARRLLRPTAGDPFYASIDLSGAGPEGVAQEVGRRLADQLELLFQSPRTSLAMAATESGWFIDERIGPGLTVKQLADLSAPGGQLDAAWRPAERWTAPRRFRQLAPSAGFPPADRGVYLAAVDVGREEARLPPLPLAFGGVCGEGSVLCLGYSPFEAAEPWWTTRDRICDPEGSDADQFGPQRLIDMATFAGRLRPTPLERPLVREVRVPDARGGVELVVDFRPAHTQDPQFWRPRLVVPGADPAWKADLVLQSVDWPGHSAVFRLGPSETTALCDSEKGIKVEPELNGKVEGKIHFFLPRPPEQHWPSLAALESVALLAGYSGGMVGRVEDVTPRSASLRAPLLLGLTAAAAGLALLRSRWRWLPWLRWLRKGSGRSQSSRVLIDAAGLGVDYGNYAQPLPQGARRGVPDHRSPLGPGDRLEHVPRQILARFLVGIPGIPVVDRRIPTRATRLDLVVNLGESMRVCQGSHGEMLKVRFAGLVAQVLAEVYWEMGAAVRLIGVGLAAGPRVHGPFLTRNGEDGLVRLAEETARSPAASPELPRGFAPDPGTTVIWISDFLTEPDLPGLLGWGAGLSDEDGRFAAVHARIPEELELVGFGFTRRPFALLDRTAVGPEDLREAARRHVADLRRRLAGAGLAFAAVSGEMTGQCLIEELEQSGLLGRTI